MRIGNKEIDLSSKQVRFLAVGLFALVLIGIFLVSARCGSLAVQNHDPGITEPEGDEMPEELDLPAEPEPPVYPEDNPALSTGVLVMIDNQEAARPQTGIDKADVVFEIIAEGGITRYMALFYTEAAQVIGPVRSARYYFVQLAKGMDLPYAHVGGADDSIAMISELKIKDINEISNAARYFWQDPKRSRPHSTYTSTDNLVEAVINKKYQEKAPQLPPYAAEFQGEKLDSGRVVLTYATGRYGYQAEWRWQDDKAAAIASGPGGASALPSTSTPATAPVSAATQGATEADPVAAAATGRYYRYINGEAQVTTEGAPLVADTIFIIAAASKHRNTDPITSSVAIIGGGEAVCIVDNKIIYGTWRKEAADKPLEFLDKDGRPMSRKVGKTWVQVVNTMADVDFSAASPR